jgi:hypothetical protein
MLIVLLILSVVAFAFGGLAFFASLMSDTPGSKMALQGCVIAGVGIVGIIICIVALCQRS